MGPQHEQTTPREKPTESERSQIVQLMRQVSYQDIQFIRLGDVGEMVVRQTFSKLLRKQ